MTHVESASDDESFLGRNCYKIQVSSDFIGVLQTVRNLANNARNCVML